MKLRIGCVAVGLLSLVYSLSGQTAGNRPASAQVPPFIQFSGVVTDVNGKPLTGMMGITFCLYTEQQGGSPLWLETQNVQPDETGHYTVLLGSATSQGLPASIFTFGQAHWLGVQVQGEGQVEQPRVLLVSAPYALKAADAETVGGLPASAFVLAVTPTAASAAGGVALTSRATAEGGGKSSQPTTCDVTSDGKAGVNALAKFTTPCNVEASTILDSSGRVGIGSAGLTTSKLYLTDTQTNFGTKWLQQNIFNTSATSNGTNYGLGIDANVSNMTIASGVTDGGYRIALLGRGYAATTGFAGTLATQYGVLAEVGISQGKSGAKVTSAYGGNFTIINNAPGTTISNAYGVYISNSGTAGTITNRYDLYASSVNARNYFAGNVGIGTTSPADKLDVNGNLSATGMVSASSFNIGGNLFAFGSYATGNVFLGFAGNTTTTGTANLGSGGQALFYNTTGSNNTADGVFALYQNTTGSANTASGWQALFSNTTGFNNTASGIEALLSNTTGHDNTAAGVYALIFNTTGIFNTANGSQALYSNSTGSNNTASGFDALVNNTSGSNNTASGYLALTSNTSGGGNAAIGDSTLFYNTTGIGNTASGEEALNNNTTGNDNTAGGSQALIYNTTGSYNTALGYFAGPDAGSPNLANATALGAYATVSESNALVLGCTVGSNDCPAAVSVGIATTTPSNVFTVGQGAGHAIADGWDTYSSRRWKTNIHTLHAALASVEQLRGVSYDLKDSGKHEIGVIAEEVSAVVPEVVSWEKNGTDVRGVDYGRLTALLIEATKEQQALIHRQQQQIRIQQAQIARLASQVTAIRTLLKTNGALEPELHSVNAAGPITGKRANKE
jgi:hypothetical protein